MRIKSKRLVTLSFFATVLLVLLMWLGRDESGNAPSQDTGPPPLLDTVPQPNRRILPPRVPLTSVAHLKIDPATLGARLILRGLVTTTEDAPIEGASVTLYASRHLTTREFSDPLVVDMTGADGRFQMQLDIGLQTWLEVTSPGFAPVDERLDLETPGIRQKYYRLRPASASIEGRVFDEAGDPIPGVFVGVAFPQTYSRARGHSVSPQTTRSEASGYFELKPLPAGEITLTLLDPGYYPAGTVVKLDDGETHRLEIRLKEAPTVSIQVQNRRRQGLSSATIRLESGWGFPADDQGVVRVMLQAGEDADDGLGSASLDGAVRMMVAAKGYRSESVVFDPAEPLTTVTLEDGLHVQGRVLSETGQPVAGASVGIWSGPGREREQVEKFMKTDSEGTFSLVLERQPVRRFTAQAPGYVPRTVIPEGNSTDLIEIRLKPGEGGIQGRVVDAQNRPVELFSLYLRSTSPNGEHLQISQSFQNPQGGFSVLDLMAGEYLINIRGLDRNTHMPISEGETTVQVQKGHLSGEIVVPLIDLAPIEDRQPETDGSADETHRHSERLRPVPKNRAAFLCSQICFGIAPIQSKTTPVHILPVRAASGSSPFLQG